MKSQVSRPPSLSLSRPPSAYQISESSESTLDTRPVEEQFPATPSQQLARLKDSKKAWFVCFAAFLIQVLDVGVLHVFGVFFVPLVEEFDSTRATIAWVGSLAYGLTMLLGVFATAAINKVGARAVAMTGSLICSLSLLISSFAPSIQILFVTFSIMYGLGTSLAYTPTMCIADDYFTRYVSLATGIMTAGSSTGTLLLSPIAQSLITHAGWRNAFRVFAGLTLVCMYCGWMFKPLLEVERVSPPTQSEQIKKITITRRLMQEFQLWKNKVYTVYVASVTCCMFGYYIPYVHLVSHVTNIGMTSEDGSSLLMILGGATAVGRLMFGKIVESGYLNRVHMHQLSMVITGSACMLLPAIRTFGGLVGYVICMGLVDGCYVVLLPVLTTQLVGLENRVMGWGFLVAMSSVTFTLGPPVAGWISDVTGSYDMAFHIAAVPIIGGAVILFLVPWAQRTASSVNIMAVAKTESDPDAEEEEYDMMSEGAGLDLTDALLKIETRTSCLVIDLGRQNVMHCRRRCTSESAAASTYLGGDAAGVIHPTDRPSYSGISEGLRTSPAANERHRSYSESTQDSCRLPDDVLQALSVLRRHSNTLHNLTASDTGLLERVNSLQKTSEHTLPDSLHDGVPSSQRNSIHDGHFMQDAVETSSLLNDQQDDHSITSAHNNTTSHLLDDTESSHSSLAENSCVKEVVSQEDIDLAISNLSASPRDGLAHFLPHSPNPSLPTVDEEPTGMQSFVEPVDVHADVVADDTVAVSAEGALVSETDDEEAC